MNTRSVEPQHSVRCHNDGTQMIETTGEIQYEVDGNQIVFSGVSMVECPKCGERYVDGPLGVTVGQIAEEIRECLNRPNDWDKIVKSKKVLVALQPIRATVSAAG